MDKQALFVPVEENKELFLYKVKSWASYPPSNTGNEWIINGVIPKKLQEIKKYFEKTQPSQTIIPGITVSNSEKGRLEDLTDSTLSIYLGLFIEITRFLRHRTFKPEWNSIAVTGNFVFNDKTVELTGVEHIKQKYAGVEKYAQEHKNENHLFIYVTDEVNGNEHLPEPPDNLTIKAFTPRYPVGAIFAEIFEPHFDEEQLDLFDNSGIQEQWDYVSTPVFERIKNTALSKNWRGFFIHGEGETGKSAMVLELSKYLAEADQIFAPIWIRVNNEELIDRLSSYKLQPSVISDRKKNPLENPMTTYITEKIAGTLNLDWKPKDGLPALVKNINRNGNRRYLLVIDNLEIEEVDEVTDSIQTIIEKCSPRPPVIFTSRVAGSAMFLEKVRMTELSTKEIEKLIWSIAQTRGQACIQELTKWNGTQEYIVLLEQISFHFASFPGIIKLIIPQLDTGLPGVLQTLGNLKFPGNEANKKADAIFQTVFSRLDNYTRAVLFAFLGIKRLDLFTEYDKFVKENDLDDSIGKTSLVKKIIDRIYNTGLKFDKTSYTTAELEEMTQHALNKLTRIHILNRNLSNTANQPDDNEYYIKTLPLKILLFSESIANETIPSSGKTLRDTLINVEDLIEACIVYGQSPVLLETLLKKNIDKNCKDYSFLLNAASRSNISGHIDVLVKYGYKKINKLFFYAGNITALYFAVKLNQNKEVVQRLLFYGAKIDVTDKYGQTPLHFAARYNQNPEIIDLLLRNKAKIDITDEDGRTPLHFAARYNQKPEIIDLLLKNEATVDITDKDGETPLHYAARNKNIEVFKHLIREDFSLLLCPNSDGLTPLFELVMNSTDPNIISWLKDNHVELNITTSTGASLLHFAAFNDNETILKKLLEEGADINVTDIEGSTILHYAAMNSELDLMDEDMFTILLEKGLTIHAVNSAGGTPLHTAAAYNDDLDSVSLILRKGARTDINAKTVDGGTPLHCAACYNENLDIIKLLLKNEAYIHATDIYGSTPLHYAAKINNNPEIIVTLIKAGARLEDKDKKGKSAFSYLKKRKDWAIIKKAIKNI